MFFTRANKLIALCEGKDFFELLSYLEKKGADDQFVKLAKKYDKEPKKVMERIKVIIERHARDIKVPMTVVNQIVTQIEDDIKKGLI